MARVTVEDCIEKVPNRFGLVLLAGPRARAIANGAALTLDRDNDKNPVVALRERAEDTVLPEDLTETIVGALHRVDERTEAEDAAEDWIRASTRPRTRSPYSGLDYGYGWFLSRTGWVIARGYGGQLIASHETRGLAVAITSDPNQPARSDGHFGALMRLLDGPILNAA